MNIFNMIKSNNCEIKKIRKVGYILSTLLALVSIMILCIYKSTGILFQFNLGLTLLKISIILFTAFSICYIGFSKILEEMGP